MDRTEMLTPAGDARLVVPTGCVEAIVAKGYIVIGPTDKDPLTHDAVALGLEEEAPVAEDVEEPKVELAADESEGEVVALATDESLARDAIAAIDEINDSDALKAYIEGETRATVLQAAEEREQDFQGNVT